MEAASTAFAASAASRGALPVAETAPHPPEPNPAPPMARSLRACALASALAAAAAAGPLREDAEALVQLGAAVERYDPSGACRCLEWNDVYATRGVECGDGQELTWTTVGDQNKTMLLKKFCTGFYKKLYSRMCVNLHFETQSTDQWCYVSADCKNLNGGGAVGGIQWKVCNPASDNLMSVKTPQYLARVAEMQAKDVGLFFKMAYPTYEKGLMWPDVEKCMKKGASQPKCAKLERVQAEKNAVLFNSEDVTAPFGVVQGSSIMEVHYTKETVATGQDPLAQALTLSRYTCRAGCHK